MLLALILVDAADNWTKVGAIAAIVAAVAGVVAVLVGVVDVVLTRRASTAADLQTARLRPSPRVLVRSNDGAAGTEITLRQGRFPRLDAEAPVSEQVELALSTLPDPDPPGNSPLFATLAYTLLEARVVVHDWVEQYNQHRPHGALGDTPPSQYHKQYMTKLHTELSTSNH